MILIFNNLFSRCLAYIQSQVQSKSIKVKLLKKNKMVITGILIQLRLLYDWNNILNAFHLYWNQRLAYASGDLVLFSKDILHIVCYQSR